VTGAFSETVDFNPLPKETEYHTSIGQNDVFLSKFDSKGNYDWARTWGTTGNDVGQGVAMDGWLYAYVTGATQNGDKMDIFLYKYDSLGGTIWGKTWGGTSAGTGGYGNGVDVDTLGNAYVTGFYGGPVDFDPGPGEDIHTSADGRDVFLSKLDSEGNFIWAKTWGWLNWDSGLGVAVDGSGYSYVTGNFAGTVDFDPGPGEDIHDSNGSLNAFLSKFAP
jgi:uncharacterized protein YcfJ